MLMKFAQHWINYNPEPQLEFYPYQAKRFHAPRQGGLAGTAQVETNQAPNNANLIPNATVL